MEKLGGGSVKKVKNLGKNFHAQLCPPFLKKPVPSPTRGDYTPTPSPPIPPYSPNIIINPLTPICPTPKKSKKLHHFPNFGTMFAKRLLQSKILETMANPFAELMAETMATSALTGIMGTDASALTPMVSALSKMDEKQMATAINTLTPLVGMLSQLSKK